MANYRIEKEPGEKFVVAGSLYNVLLDGELVDVSESSIEVRDKGNRNVTSTIIVDGTTVRGADERGGTGNTLQVQIQSGSVNLSPYTIAFTIVTTSGNTYVVHGKIVVKETTFVVSTTTTSSTTTTTSP